MEVAPTPGDRPWVVTFSGCHCSCQCAYYWNAFLIPSANVVAKVMFLHLSVCYSVHRGVSASVHAGLHPPGADTPPRSRHPPPKEQTPPRSRHPLRSACKEIRATSGRYASYWNAFLFEIILAKSCGSHVVWSFSGKCNCLLCTGFFSTDICRQYPTPLHTAWKQIQLVFFWFCPFCYLPQKKLWEGNVFTGVCVCTGWGVR